MIIPIDRQNFSASFAQEYEQYTAAHSLKSRDGTCPVVVAPLVLFCDDTSGNKGKKWNKFDSWSFTLAGLPQNESHKPINCHFISCSNRVTPIDMAKPIADQLKKLEKGVKCYDAKLQKEVLLQAPVILLCADNPRHSELLNHLGSSANKFCRMCMVRNIIMIPCCRHR